MWDGFLTIFLYCTVLSCVLYSILVLLNFGNCFSFFLDFLPPTFLLPLLLSWLYSSFYFLNYQIFILFITICCCLPYLFVVFLISIFLHGDDDNLNWNIVNKTLRLSLYLRSEAAVNIVLHFIFSFHSVRLILCLCFSSVIFYCLVRSFCFNDFNKLCC